MCSKPVRIVVLLALTAAAVTDGMPSNVKRTNQNQVQAEVPKAIQINAKDAIGKTAIRYPNQRHSIRPSNNRMQTGMVDDDLLEFLVRVADNPAEWNKIQRVLNMLGREEMGMPEGSDAIASTSPTIITTTMSVPLMSTTNSLPSLPPPLPMQHNTAISPPQQPNTSASPPLSQQKSTSVSSAPLPQPKTSVLPTPWKHRMTTVPEPPRQPETMVPRPPQKITVPGLQLQQLKTTQQTVTSSSSWPSGDWILEVVEKIRAAAKARRKGSSSDAGDTYDYDEDDGGDDEDDYSNDEIEEIEEPAVAPTDASFVPATAHPPPPQPPRLPAGHMSRYQFRRIDGRPDDGRVNGTYVAVVESDRPSRGVIYDPARQKKPNDAVN